MELFRLAEYDKAYRSFINTTVFELMRCKNPFGESFPIVQSEDRPSSQVTSPSGEVVEFQRKYHGYKYSLEYKDVFNGNAEGLIASLDGAADQQLSTIVPRILETFNRVAEAFGNKIDAKGQQLNHDLINQLLEKTEIPFDEWGHPIMPTVFMHPETENRLRSIPLTSQQRLKRREIIERKRREFERGKRRRELQNEKI